MARSHFFTQFKIFNEIISLSTVAKILVGVQINDDQFVALDNSFHLLVLFISEAVAEFLNIHLRNEGVQDASSLLMHRKLLEALSSFFNQIDDTLDEGPEGAEVVWILVGVGETCFRVFNQASAHPPPVQDTVGCKSRHDDTYQIFKYLSSSARPEVARRTTCSSYLIIYYNSSYLTNV